MGSEGGFSVIFQDLSTMTAMRSTGRISSARVGRSRPWLVDDGWNDFRAYHGSIRPMSSSDTSGTQRPGRSLVLCVGASPILALAIVVVAACIWPGAIVPGPRSRESVQPSDPTPASSAWVGKRVIRRAGRVPIGDRRSDRWGAAPLLIDRVVEKRTASRLRIEPEGGGPIGWARVDEVVAIDQPFETFHQRVRDNPKDTFALAIRALVLLDRGEFDRAIADCDAALRIDPKLGLAVLPSRHCSGSTSGSSNTALSPISTWPSELDPEHVRQMGARHRPDRQGGSGQCPPRVSARPSSSSRVRLGLPRSGSCSGWPRRSSTRQRSRTWTRPSVLDDRSAETHVSRGLALVGKQRYDQAIDDFDAAITLDPKLARAYFDRGNAWLELKEYPKALDDYKQAVRLNPNVAFVYSSAGVTWASPKPPEDAQADFDALLRLDPQFVLAYDGRGYARLQTKAYDGAIQDLDEAIRLDPRDAFAYYNRGVIRWLRLDDDRAIADFEQSFRLDGHHAFPHAGRAAATYDRRGKARLEREDYDGAIVDFTHAIRLVPADAAAFLGRGAAWAEKHIPDKALADLTKSIQLWPNPQAYYDRGSVWLEKEEYENAFEDFGEAIRLKPSTVPSTTLFVHERCPALAVRGSPRGSQYGDSSRTGRPGLLYPTRRRIRGAEGVRQGRRRLRCSRQARSEVGYGLPQPCQDLDLE